MLLCNPLQPSQTVDVSLVRLAPDVVDPWHGLGAPDKGGPTRPVKVGEDGQATPAPEPSSALNQVFRGGFRHVKVLQIETGMLLLIRSGH